jgi:hypothetical protein
MKEEFLHYIWKYGLFDPRSFIGSCREKITVLNPGEYNRDSGPDFFNARISIGGTVWAGNVEIHTKASYFEIHGHHRDPAYDNIILHVVSENDKKVFNTKGEEIPTVVMKFDPSLWERYTELINNPCVIACQDEIGKIETFRISAWLNSLAVERLIQKSESILKIYSETGNDWEETFYRQMSRYFGFRVNAGPFSMLAKALPYRIIRKHTDNRFQLEALLFGTAGMLEEKLFRDAVRDEYYRNLAREYSVLSAKYSLQPVHGWLWKFSKLRPANFPTLRISQLAGMFSVAGGLFSKVMETDGAERLREIFSVSASEYWDDHFIFGKKSRNVRKSTGSQATDILLINAVIPVIFAYGHSRDRSDIRGKALELLGEVRSEQNIIIEEWNKAGIRAGSALCSQALIQLKDNYCKKRRCLDCRIGNMLIMTGKTLRDHEELMLEP